MFPGCAPGVPDEQQISECSPDVLQACPMSEFWYLTPSRVILCKKADVADLVISHPKEAPPAGPQDLVLQRLVIKHALAYEESRPSRVSVEGSNTVRWEFRGLLPHGGGREITLWILGRGSRPPRECFWV
jgi:hypothetical protein